MVFAPAAAPLAAFGLDRLSQPESSAWLSRTTKTLLGAAAILALTGMVFGLTPLKTIVNDDRLMITALAAAGAAAIFAGWRAGAIPARSGSAALLALVLLELGNVTNYLL